MGRIIGVDYGERRVGVAVSDELGRLAFPRTVLANDDTLLDRIAAIVEEEAPKCIVIGEADNPAGGTNTIARRIALFVEALRVRTKLPVEPVTEAYSSAEARRALEEKVASRKDARVPVDAAAAAIILQTYLDRPVPNQ